MTPGQRQGLLLLALFLALAGTGVTLLVGWKRAKNAEKYLPLLNATEARLGIPRDLLARMAYQESHFRDDIVSGSLKSPAGALGIMQIVPKWHPDISVQDILNPATAIPYAGQFLARLYKKFGTWELAVAAYNWGEGNVAKNPGHYPTETLNYVTSVFRDLGRTVV